MNHPVDGKLKDLNPSLLEELELTLEGSAAELPETKIPLWERLGQLVEVTGAQRLPEHEPRSRCPVPASLDCSFPT